MDGGTPNPSRTLHKLLLIRIWEHRGGRWKQFPTATSTLLLFLLFLASRVSLLLHAVCNPYFPIFILSLSLLKSRARVPALNHECVQVGWGYDPPGQYFGPPSQNLRHQIMLRYAPFSPSHSQLCLFPGKAKENSKEKWISLFSPLKIARSGKFYSVMRTTFYLNLFRVFFFQQPIGALVLSVWLLRNGREKDKEINFVKIFSFFSSPI